MFTVTVNVPTLAHGEIAVEAEIEYRPTGERYHIGTVRDALGRPVECSLDLLEEIETSLDFEMQCARYDALFFSVEDPLHISLYA